MSEASTPASVQRYELGEAIAKGGMGEVYRARAFGAHGFSKDVAIKRILPHLVHPEFEQRFIAEAKLAARLNHANIVSVIDFGREGDALFIAMEYVDGVDLASLLAERLMSQRPIPLSAALHIAIGICTGLDFAHDQGVLHRDVSPANVLLSTAGEVKIADFGLAKATGGRGPTRANRVMGKWRYMSPEQSRAEDLDRRSDLFAAAIVIHELCTGRPLFVGRDAEVIVKKIRDGVVPPPSAARPDLPPVFDAVLARALQVDRDARFQSGDDMVRALTEACYSCNLIHTPKDVANLVRESSSAAPPVPEASPPAVRQPTEATPMELSAAADPMDHAGATRTFIRSGVDNLGLSHWNVTTTFHTTAEVEPMQRPAPGRRRVVWPAIAGLVLAAAIGALAVTAGGGASSEGGVAGVDAAVVADNPIDASLAIDEIDGSLVIDTVDAATDVDVEIKLRVTSAPPGAAVTLDGKRIGTTPMTASLAPRPGRGKLAIVKAGYAPVELKVSRERGARVHRKLDRLEATIKVGVTESWAKVYVGDRYVGDTPLRSLKLPYGTHRLRLENPETGKSRTVSVTVPADKPYVFKF